MREKILVIEDEEILRTLLQKKLEIEGFRVVTAQDGETGLAMVKSEKPDLVLLDIILPKKDGFEVLEALQKDSELKKIPVIIISNSGQPVELDQARKLGAKDWIIKTIFDPKEVIEKVKLQLGS